MQWSEQLTTHVSSPGWPADEFFETVAPNLTAPVLADPSDAQVQSAASTQAEWMAERYQEEGPSDDSWSRITWSKWV